MNKKIIKKILPLSIILTLFLLPTTAVSQTTTTPKTSEQTTLPIRIEQHLEEQLTKNDSNRYIIISAGIRATSFFLKIPRPLTQRGLILIAEIKYRSPLAFTLVIQRSPQEGISINTFNRGTHRVIYFGLGHSAFSRPHVGSFGRLLGITNIQPIVF